MKKLILSFGYSGFAPFAPGTVASAIVAASYFCLLHLVSPEWLLCGMVLLAIFFAASTAFWGRWAETLSGRAASKSHQDPGWVVSDEVAGQAVALFFAASYLDVTLAFVLFRFFDILKPYPIKKLEQLGEGWGILLDDVASGVVALCIMQSVRLLLL